MNYIEKRDGKIVLFDSRKIKEAVRKALVSTGEDTKINETALGVLVDKIISNVDTGKPMDYVPNVEEIQDAVEDMLMRSGYYKTAKAYITYRYKHEQIRDGRKVAIDVESTMNDYIDNIDWRVSANANIGYSLGGLILNVSGKVTANYWLNHVYTKEIRDAHFNGDIYIHDLDMLSGYCAGWSLRELLEQGYNGVYGKVSSNPPKHLRTAIGQIINFIGTLQNEWAGAQAFSSFDTFLAPFVWVDELSYNEVKQCMQELVYNLNVPSRWGNQTPFSNITLDVKCPEDMVLWHPVIGGKEQNVTYGILQKEMDMINKAFVEVMYEGDANGRIFTFPIPTYNITKDFEWNSEIAGGIFAMTAKYGVPYFQNFITSDLDPRDIRSMCCRLQLSLSELHKRGNGLFGSADKTGSIGVVTINMARLGYLYKDDGDGLLKRLDELMDLAKESLVTKKKVLTRLLDSGMFPYTKRYLGHFNNHFSTIGINGMHECIQNYSGGEHGIGDECGRKIAEETMMHMRERISRYQHDDGILFNLEATPAEGASYRFARKDKELYPDIIQSGEVENVYYTNSTQLPVGYSDDVFECLKHQESLQRLYTGGTVFHMYVGEKIPSGEVCKKLVKRTFENFAIPYLTITPVFSICPKHGYIAGEHKFCPVCDEEIIHEKLKNI
jgi:ribonucleoside-triphosphate reductase